VRDCLADHAQGCYGGSTPKSMKAEELAVFQESCRRKIVITSQADDHFLRASCSSYDGA